VFKFSRYPQGAKFKAHMDGSFVQSEECRSIFTVLVYLNDDYEGGDTTFYKHTDITEPVCRVRPQQGTALIFNHDVIHSGTEVSSGIKYIVKTEIMFTRTSSHQFWLLPRHQEEYQRVKDLYSKSDKLEKLGDVVNATESSVLTSFVIAIFHYGIHSR